MHHADLILKPAEPVHTVHVPDQGLQTLVRHTDDELKFQFPGISQAHLAPLLIHLGERFVQKHKADLGIPVALLHRCLRAELMRYFGQPCAPQCGNCSVCLGEGSAAGEAVNFGGAAVRRQAKPLAEGPMDSGLFERLKKKRAELARRQGVPAFVVFTDATLRQMCIQAPADRAALLQVSGVGEAKARRYGDEMLEVIRAWKEEQGS